jgi:HEAT repeat protein
MAVVVACERFLEGGQTAPDAIYEVLAQAGRSRRSHPELLRLYDPVAYQIFHTPEGIAHQKRLAAGLDAEEWPTHFAEAMVRAAPVPTLEWMEHQADSNAPNLTHLRQIWQQWGWWIRSGNERQHADAVQRVAARLLENRAIVEDATTHAALIRFIGESRSANLLPFVITGLGFASDSAVRSASALAIGRLAAKASLSEEQSERAMGALIDASNRESNAEVLSKIAEAMESFPKSQRAGQGMLDLFKRSQDAGVRRAILFSTAASEWPQRSQLVLEGIRADGGGVLAAALQAVTAHPSPELVDPTLSLFGTLKSPQPSIIEALGALRDKRATPTLVAWLNAEQNASVRLLIALALGNIADDGAREALLEQLKREDNAFVMDHLVTIAGQLQLDGSEPILIALAEDQTAPLNVRSSAIWSVGHFDSAAVREALARWSAQPEKFFGDPQDPNLPAGQYERLEQIRMHVLGARIRTGDEEAIRQIGPLFDRGTPTAQLSLLIMLADLKRDDPVTTKGLKSSDFAVLIAAINAAEATNPQKYLAEVKAIREAPFIAALLESGLDTHSLHETLDSAIAAGEKP